MDPFPHFSSTDFPITFILFGVFPSLRWLHCQTFLIVLPHFEILFSDLPCVVVALFLDCFLLYSLFTI